MNLTENLDGAAPGLALQRARGNGYVSDFKDRIAGCLTGTAVGDSLGLPYEALSRRRVRKRLRLPLRHSFLFRRGMVSDDTEHTVMVARSLLYAGDDPGRFAGRLALQLKLWFLMLPPGIGWGTLRACLKLLLGFGPGRSGVNSAGNGPAMRAALLGALYCNRETLRCQFTEASTLITHRDPRAETGARAVAEIAAIAIKSDRAERPDQDAVRSCLAKLAPKDVEWRKLVNRMDCAWKRGTTVQDFADSLNLADGVTGYIYHTVPVAIYAWYQCYNDFEKCLTDVISCGGDTDTVGAVAGALCGITVGVNGIPEEWKRGIWDAPCSGKLLDQLGSGLNERYEKPCTQVPVPAFKWWILPFRNLFFFLVVLCHIAGRLLNLGGR